MNLSDLEVKARSLAADKQRGLPLLAHETTYDRLTPSRMRDLGTHVRSIHTALGRAKAAEVAASELTEAAAARVRQHLQDQGKKVGVIDSTLGSFRLLRDLATELGEAIAPEPTFERPARNKVYETCKETGRVKRVSRAVHVVNNKPYGLRWKNWPDSLRREYETEIWPFFCDPHAERRSKKRPAGPKYMKTWLNRVERAFGYRVHMCGESVETLSFRSMMDFELLRGYHRWLYERRGGNTETTKNDLDQWRHLAESLYQLPELAKELSAFIHHKNEWHTVKDKEELPLIVHADDLYTLFYALIAEAEHYEANLKRKYGRVDAPAQAAHKWMEAGVVGLTVVTWLRRANVAEATPQNLFQQEDGAWFFKFSRPEMKSKRNHADHVIDLWRGPEAQAMINRVLTKCAEQRPLLLARFRRENPGKPDPVTFFLNSRGDFYEPSTVGNLFASSSQRYLGHAKRISPHDVRTIIPSWLFVREGIDMLPTVQRRLDHSKIETTHRFYLKVQRVFDSRMAQAQMNERAKERRAKEQFQKLPDQVMAVVLKAIEEMDRRNAQANAAIDPAVLKAILAELLGLDGEEGEETA